MEEALSLEELMATLNASKEREHRERKFMAALKGIDLDANEKREAMERVREEMERLEDERGPSASSQLENPLTAWGISVQEEGD